MNTFTAKVQPNVEIVITSIDGDLIIEGLEVEELFASGDEPNVTITDDGARVHIECEGDCTLRVPVGAIIQVAEVAGDTRITNIANDIDLQDVGGDLIIRNCGQARIGDVGGDLEIKRLQGSLSASGIGGDADISRVEGDLDIHEIGGDLAISRAVNGCRVGEVGGDMIISALFIEGVHHDYGEIGGDIVIKVAPESSVSFEIPHSVERIIHLRGAQVFTDEHAERDTITLADGAALVKIGEIGGDLVLSRQGSGDQFDHILEDLIPVDLDEMIAEQMSKAQAQIEANRARIEREVERATKNAGKYAKRGFNFGFQFGTPPAPATPPNRPTPPRPPTINVPVNGFSKAPKADKTSDQQPVSDDERMLILKMVESGRIKIEEAERLFAALEGRNSG